jgi:leucyl/phenylalanyl-tRNA--protein transferase
MPTQTPALPWLEPGDAFPNIESAWGSQSNAPGLLAAGGDLSTATLRRAYSEGIFPWFSDGQPILWWSPAPRMVLKTSDFKLHRSFKKTLQRFTQDRGCEIRFDTAFEEVILSCASAQRHGQPGTWIVPAMVQAYVRLHRAGYAHSVETWVNGNLVGGLYCVAIGRAVFGESMFTQAPDASKIALAGLVAFCKAHAIAIIDCQQNTPHLASLGATEIPRNQFLTCIVRAQKETAISWHFSPLYWREILSDE